MGGRTERRRWRAREGGRQQSEKSTYTQWRRLESPAGGLLPPLLPPAPPPLSSASLPSFLFSSLLLSSNFHGAHGGKGGLSPPCPHAKSAPAYTCDRGVYLDHPYISRFVLKYNFRYILRAIYSTGTKQGLTSMPQFSHQYPYDTSGHK